MVRLIDAEAVIARFEHDTLVNAIVREAMEEAKTVEAVPVVRCRECVNYKPLDKNRPYSCSVGMDEVTGDDYCSRGAKMDEVSE